MVVVVVVVPRRVTVQLSWRARDKNRGTNGGGVAGFPHPPKGAGLGRISSTPWTGFQRPFPPPGQRGQTLSANLETWVQQRKKGLQPRHFGWKKARKVTRSWQDLLAGGETSVWGFQPRIVKELQPRVSVLPPPPPLWMLPLPVPLLLPVPLVPRPRRSNPRPTPLLPRSDTRRGRRWKWGEGAATPSWSTPGEDGKGGCRRMQ